MGRWLMALLLVMLSSLATKAAEAYACYTTSNTTLTFYYDNLRSSRTGTTYDLNEGDYFPDWYDDINQSVTRAVFDPSFAGATPTSTLSWLVKCQTSNPSRVSITSTRLTLLTCMLCSRAAPV